MSQLQRLSVIGLGKLGASMAAAFASRGYQVIGVDVLRQSVDAINEGRAPVGETGLNELIGANRIRIRATMSTVEAVTNSDVSFVIVPTPSDSRGAFSLQYAAHAFRELGLALREKSGYHLVVLTSTVLPGSCRHGLIPVLEKASGKTCGVDFGFCYNPEFIALGSVIRDLLNPDFFLVGEYDRRSGDTLESIYSHFPENGAKACRMSIENAELSKISLNSFVTLKISFANMLADLCTRIPGGDVDVVCNAIGNDKRVGHAYLKGGAGFGGPCFPRDNVALSFLGKQVGAATEMLECNDHFNRGLPGRIATEIMKWVDKPNTIVVLGLSYKPGSHIVEESQAIDLCKLLSDAGYRTLGFDPMANASAEVLLKYHALVVGSIEECLSEADAVVIANPDPVFRALDADKLLSKRSRMTVIDIWRCAHPSVVASERIRYVPLGKCPSSESSDEILKRLWTQTTGK